ncbi:NAD(P)-dependent oxidoreductase [Magnetospirillum sp. UT-4]|uniref:SDR family oxidoreductase n=1 Tax=Magnetospirillum sp. UT-4 TaxID=2681467 RepID=UPI00137C4EBE|nr:NAD(P)-dependent oxidoreductase [Magnetospirillum sp. UT-4]CAA7621641.1 putative dTDP-4-keto-6-deoxy-D-glucose reductase [Magnetospirillum sp. UT-4]
MAGALAGKRVLVTGAAGMLGRAFAESLAAYPCTVIARSHAALDVTDRAAVLAETADIAVHCAADVNAERCETQPEETRRIQVEGTRNVAALGARVLYPQSFLIFDGSHLPIDEATPPNPLSVYGRAKLEAERLLPPESLVVRMAGFFGGEEADKNFVGLFTRKLAQLLAEGAESYGVGDRVWQPTWTVDLARNCALLLDEGRQGVYTMSCHGEASFWELATACVEELGVGHRIRIDKVPASQVAGGERAKRPARAVMDNARLRAEGLDRMRPWREALAEYLARPYFQALFAPYR